MKNTPLILSIIALVIALLCGIFQLTSGNGKTESVVAEGTETVAEKGAVVFFNLDRVLNEYDMANDLSSVVETKVQSIQQEINRRGNNLQKKANEFQEKIDKGLITRSVAEVQAEKLNQEQNEFNTYANQKQQEIAEEQSVMMNQIGDAIKKYIDKLNEEKQYALIVSTSGDILPSPIVAGEGTLDITDVIIAGLNEEYVRNKAKENN
ncbi:MAG: OmpH family outer membrane protein [Bacteroidales bacterium]|nr:OmpH family outer membrane protein [Bacteroidales bacterium]